MPRSIAEKRALFRELHLAGCFVIPNPWDVGSARYLEHAGFQAIATTSSGFAWSTGRPDNGVTRDSVLAHLRTLVEATDLPVNADFESGFGSTPDEVAHSVKMAVATGVAGLSIEDSTGDANAPLFPIDEAVARLRAARRAIDETGGDTLLVGRAENFFAGVPDLDDTVARLKAYADAGADCLYAPGIQSAEQIRTVVTAVAPRPVNVLVGATSPFTLQDLADLGVRRVSVGGALARAAWGGFMHAAQALAEGRFDGFDGAASGATLNGLFQPGR
ncbi:MULTISPECIES: isocitrate lyase/PEP mutase family protein [Pandoraea]|jgi:2-methylisocitrate lyase-like PEP mutase family enzyme|uniref:isocitrate lyase/PEP mutase family protein n=1 Tax=Pandoraea TaxID=93217 RepID=UPI0003C77639|nr:MULTISPECIES: isocitrate lyase/phosphoenolpyruvate mutase family protein [Pandoraea]AHB05425.1 2-methylisocitrate lyase [Pandoraea pnomenusa 3kgm]AHB74207.1 2-methylisocitrate lyase [Pandoraea pnomenusa]